MKKIALHLTNAILSFLLLFFGCTVSAQNTNNCKPCEALKELQLPDVIILSADPKSLDTIYNSIEPWVPTVIIKRPFCRVLGRISKEIHFELLLPAKGNGRFLMSGGGGFVGYIQDWLRDYVNRGFATVGTDAGHIGGDDAKWAYNNMERQLNFGKLAIHRTAVVSKLIMQAYYCAAPTKSYFVGCSRGGGQALMEAQHYPEDFDGIVAGAPAYPWPAIAAKFAKEIQYNYPNKKSLKPVLTNDNLQLLENEALRQCDLQDGVADSIIDDPRKCRFDLSKLPVCPGDKAGSGCLTKQQLATARAVYDPLIVEGKQIYPGFPPGAEAEPNSWDAWISGTSPYIPGPSFHYMFSTNIFKYLIFNDSMWDYSTYTFKNFKEQTAYASAYLDATNTDYSEFKKRNGKLILYHGWNDPALSAYATIEHYEGILKGDKDATSYTRFFLLPGVLHCGYGRGCSDVDWVSMIVDWVENSLAPTEVFASKTVEGKTITKKILAYTKD